MNNADQTADFVEIVNGHTHKTYQNNSGENVVEYWRIDSMVHAVAVNPGNGPKQGGSTGSYAEDIGVWSAY